MPAGGKRKINTSFLTASRKAVSHQYIWISESESEGIYLPDGKILAIYYHSL